MENKIGYEDGKAVHVTDFEFPDNDQPLDQREKLRDFVLEIRLETLREFVAMLLEGDADVNRSRAARTFDCVWHETTSGANANGTSLRAAFESIQHQPWHKEKLRNL